MNTCACRILQSTSTFLVATSACALACSCVPVCGGPAASNNFASVCNIKHVRMSFQLAEKSTDMLPL